MRFKKYLLPVAMILILMSGCASDETKKMSHLKNGNKFFEQGEFKKAAIEFKNALQIDPAFPEGHFMMGKVSLAQGNYQGGFNSFLKVEKLSPDHLGARLELARMFNAAGKREDALSRINFILGKKPDNVEALMMKSAFLIGDGDFSGALSYLEPLSEKNIDKPEIYLMLAGAYNGFAKT